MIYRIAADGILLIHLGFILFVVLGALAVFRFPRFACIHLPAAAWGAFVELSGRLCPLTTLENVLRTRAGQAGYADSFIEHYVVSIIYPAGLTRGMQLSLAGFVVVVNVILYALVIRRRLAMSPSRRRDDRF